MSDTTLVSWPPQDPGGTLTLIASYADSDMAILGGDIVEISAAVRPSGPGEATLTAVVPIGARLAYEVEGGVPGRVYVIQTAVTGISGAVLVRPVQLPMAGGAAIQLSPSPMSADFGPPVTWTKDVTMAWVPTVAVADDLVAIGTDQGSAAQITAVENIFGTVDPGTGAILPDSIASGIISVQNQGLNELLVYPPAGAFINNQPANGPVTVSPGQRVVFASNSPAVKWRAS